MDECVNPIIVALFSLQQHCFYIFAQISTLYILICLFYSCILLFIHMHHLLPLLWCTRLEPKISELKSKGQSTEVLCLMSIPCVSGLKQISHVFYMFTLVVVFKQLFDHKGLIDVSSWSKSNKVYLEAKSTTIFPWRVYNHRCDQPPLAWTDMQEMPHREHQH